MYQIVK
jgi:hypothetical protein